MNQAGAVEVPEEAFLAVLTSGKTHVGSPGRVRADEPHVGAVEVRREPFLAVLNIGHDVRR